MHAWQQEHVNAEASQCTELVSRSAALDIEFALGAHGE